MRNMKKEKIVYVQATFIDDIGNEVFGDAAIEFNDIVEKLQTMGYEVKKE